MSWINGKLASIAVITTTSAVAVATSLFQSSPLNNNVHAVSAPTPLSTPTFVHVSDTELKKRYPEDLQLKLVQFITRHGARTAVSTRLDPHIPATWSCDVEHAPVDALTLTGKDSGYLAGSAGSTGNTGNTNATGTEVGAENSMALYRLVHIAGRQTILGTCYSGQLTKEGKQQLLEVGACLRQLYVDRLGFLPEKFSHKDVYVRSTTIKRAIESIQNLFVGLYPPNTRGNSKASSVIDINTLHERVETMYPNYSACKRLGELKKEMQATFPQTKVHEEMEKVRDQIAQLMGLDPSLLQSSLHALYDEIIARKAHGLPIPPGITPELMTQIDKLCVKWWFDDLKRSEQLRKLVIGPFLQELSADMNNVILNSTSTSPSSSSSSAQAAGGLNSSSWKFMAFSGHDTTVAPVLISLGYDLQTWPVFASNIIFEVFEDTKTSSKNSPAVENHFVRVLYNNTPIALPDCASKARDKEGYLCPLSQFNAILAKSFPTNYKEDCKSGKV